MFLKTSILTLTVTTALLLNGCSGGGDSSLTSTDGSLSLDGTWFDGLETKTFSGTDFSTAMAFDTSDMQYDVNSSGTLDVNGTKLIQPNDLNVTKISLTHTSCSGTATYKTQPDVDTANAYEYCGYTDWVINVQKDISTCSCVDKKDIYYIDGSTLQFGDYMQGLDADGYPEGLSTYLFLRQ